MSSTGLGEAVLDLRVTTGWAIAVFVVVTSTGLLVLAARRHRRWLRVGLATAVAGAVATVALAAVIIEKVWQPFPDSLPAVVYVWSGAGVLALTLLAGRWSVRGRDRLRPFVAVGLAGVALAVVICAAGGINAVYDEYPTMGAALGHDDYRIVPFDAALAPKAAPEERVPLSEWAPPKDLPRTGAVTQTSIPATVSGFSARAARIYLPPAYFADPRPDLPVLVLLAGQPGSTEDWLVGGRLTQTMDAYAADHRGLTPIVVLADGTGGWMDDPLCVDSPLGNAATYLGVDVPNWIRANLQVDPDPRAWAVGGLSYGGTCALQLATTRPEVYPTFIDMSGQAEPVHEDRPSTIRGVFGGDAEAFARNNPADLLARHRYPGSAGAFVVGTDDAESHRATRQLVTAARAAGVDVHLTELPGGHTFEVWSAGLEKEIPWLGRRLGIDAS
ncbi:alpha/beta hydrolase [Nocardia higoensis]|uniref:alpha/beta hydrolase n=1 Tax=Nocardia higoensis TaxID=228599 RepID=UPI0002F7C6C8|nr:alpha/beta hydrolase-fold protein [Nocardia higoensis]